MLPSLIGIKTIHDGAKDKKHRIISVHLVQYFRHLVTDCCMEVGPVIECKRSDNELLRSAVLLQNSTAIDVQQRSSGSDDVRLLSCHVTDHMYAHMSRGQTFPTTAFPIIDAVLIQCIWKIIPVWFVRSVDGTSVCCFSSAALARPLVKQQGCSPIDKDTYKDIALVIQGCV